jgi:Outer membrane receptor for ferrienterochelin and colicins
MKRNFRNIVLVLLLLSGMGLMAQEFVQGTVYEEIDGKKQPLPGTNIYWENTLKGVVSDANGHYRIETNPETCCLIFSYVGYENDTVHGLNKNMVYDHTLNASLVLDEVSIEARKKASYVSSIDPHHVEHVTSEGIRRAACCSLAESFETNASVDVSYSDAVTGAKQIELLGLSGLYTQMMAENMPNFRGLASAFGLNYVPGTWMNGIQISKGTSSVINGYESISGQINVDYKKPESGNSEKLFVNLFGSSMGNFEANINTRVSLNDNLHLMLLGHVNHNSMKHDGNGDSFLDDPLVTQYNIFGRVNYAKNWFEGMWGIKALKENRLSGQIDFDPDKRFDEKYNVYGIGINTQRYEAFSKTGFVFNRHETSLGIQQQFTYHKLDSYFGLTDYNASQLSYYANALFASYIGTENHKYTVGMSYSYDKYDEMLIDSTYGRIESVPGVFAEYVFSDEHHWSIIGGMRADYHNEYGLFYTPRLHLRYKTDNELTLRLSAGKGYRSPNVLAENSTILASSRVIRFLDIPRMEEAWNFGANLTKHFDIGSREFALQADVYRTDFVNQIVIDRDTDVHAINIYNLNGKSYSNSVQIELSSEIFPNFDVTAAFRYNDVKMTIGDELLEKPYVNRYKGLLSFSYAPKTWQFDFTTQFNGDSRVPSLEGNDSALESQKLERSPFYFIMNAQITKTFNKQWEVYAGGENLTNYKQNYPIIASENPFGEDFDASRVWGPLSGIKGYVGLRFKID